MEKIEEKFNNPQPTRYVYEGQEEMEKIPLVERVKENPNYLIIVDGKEINIYDSDLPEAKAARLEWIMSRPSPKQTPWSVIEENLKQFAKRCDFDLEHHHHQFYFENGVKKYYDGWDGSTIDHKFMKTGIWTYPMDEKGRYINV